MPCGNGGCGGGQDFNTDTSTDLTEIDFSGNGYDRRNGNRDNGRRESQPRPCEDRCDRQCGTGNGAGTGRRDRDRCKKPCKCPKNYVKVAPILARGSVGRGRPTIPCTTDCTFYFDTCRCALWRCFGGEWTIIDVPQGSWYFYQECSQQIWKMTTSDCRGGNCKMRNYGDESCDGDIFIDCKTCTYYVYKKCRWRPKMSCKGPDIYFATVSGQRINIISSFSSSSLVRSFATKDSKGNDIVVNNAYYDRRSGKLYTYDETVQGWIYRDLKPGENYLIDIWGTFYKIGQGNTGSVSTLDPRNSRSNGSGTCGDDCQSEGPKQGDILIDGLNCSFYTWDACNEIWVLQTTFQCGFDPEELEAPLFQTITRRSTTSNSTKVQQSDYPEFERGNLGMTVDINGDFTIPTDGTYYFRFDLDVNVFHNTADEFLIYVKVILNDDVATQANTLASVLVPVVRFTGLSRGRSFGSVGTNAILNAGDTISVYRFASLLPESLVVTINNVVITQMVNGRRPT